MKISFRKTKNGFEYYGDLTDCLEYAEKRLLQLEQNLPYITKRFLEEQKRFDTLKKSIENCKQFILSANEEIKKRIFEVNETKGKGNEDE